MSLNTIERSNRIHTWSTMSGRRGPRGRSSTNAFNPRLIFSQIVAMQCFHYLVLGFMFQINHVFYGTSVTIDRMFTDKYLKIWSAIGWADNMAVLLSSLVGYVGFLLQCSAPTSLSIT